jgi:hypothetical protein
VLECVEAAGYYILDEKLSTEAFLFDRYSLKSLTVGFDQLSRDPFVKLVQASFLILLISFVLLLEHIDKIYLLQTLPIQLEIYDLRKLLQLVPILPEGRPLGVCGFFLIERLIGSHQDG